jgi:hypothetical protein
MQNWKEPETSTIYLANGEQVDTQVNGISPEDGSGYVLVHGREVKVGPLPDTWSALGYGEIVSITLQTGEVIEAVLSPEEYLKHVAYLYRNVQIDATICLLDERSGAWREMTDQEYEKDRRTWEADEKDSAQIKREWREYRNEGLGERG